MNPTLKNAFIFIVIAGVLAGAYFLFIKKDPEAALVSSSGDPALQPVVTDATSAVGADFLSVLLNIKSIRLDDSIFNDAAFATLRDSTIQIVPDGTEGRANPFAPIGADQSAAVVNTTPTPATGTPANTPAVSGNSVQ